MKRKIRSCLYKKIASFLILLLSLCSTALGQLGNAPMRILPQFPGPLAIDGFLQRQGSAGDWLSGPGGTDNVIFTDAGVALVPLCFHFRDKFNSASDEVFSKGYLQDDPNTMKWGLRRATSKTDLNNILIFLAVNPADNHIWLALAADRRTTGKNSTIDFEFLHNQVLMTGDINTGHDKGFFSAGPDGGRTVGDLVVSVDFQNSGGSFSSIRYFQWQPGANAGTYGYFDITPPAGTAYAATNTVPINVPFGAFGSNTYAAFTFVETAVQITALLGGSAGGGGSGSIWVKSKSNDNFDDFYPPISPSASFAGLSVSYFFLDLYTAQLNASTSSSVHWTPLGATNGTFVDPSITGTLNNYDIADPIFTADTNYDCISYIYKVTESSGLETYVVINSPCKIGKPINPDEMNQGETIAEETFNDADIISVFPNPTRSAAAITLRGNNDPKDVTLIDINGATVQRWSGTSGSNLKLKEFSNGLYLLRITSKKTGNTITKKLVIEN